MSRIVTIPRSAWAHVGPYGMWATDGTCLISRHVAPPLTCKAHQTYPEDQPWEWGVDPSTGYRRTTGYAQNFLEGCIRQPRVGHRGRLAFCSRFRRVFASGHAFEASIPTVFGGRAAVGCVEIDESIVALVMPVGWHNGHGVIDIKGYPITERTP